MKATKFVVLGAALLCLIAFFLPLIHVKQGGFEGKASGFQLVKGLEDTKKAVDDAAAKAEGLIPGSTGKLAKGAKEAATLGTMVVVAPFLPALFLLLFSVIGIVKGRFGRLAGVGSLLFGLIGLAAWALLKAGGGKAADMMGIEDFFGSAVTVLMLGYVVGVIGALIAIVKKEAPAA